MVINLRESRDGLPDRKINVRHFHPGTTPPGRPPADAAGNADHCTGTAASADHALTPAGSRRSRI